MKPYLEKVHDFIEKYQKVVFGLTGIGLLAIAVLKLLDGKKPPTK